MNLPQIYMCSPSWTLLPPPFPYHPSGSSQCTSPKHLVSCIEPGLATRFIYDIIHISVALECDFHFSLSVSLLLNMLSRLVITFLPRSKSLLISWLQSPSAVILEPRKIKSDTVSTVSPSICHQVMGPDAMILVFWMLNFKPTFPLSSFTFIQRLFSSSSLSAIRVVSYAYLKSLIFLLAISNLDSSLFFLQPRVSHDVLRIQVKISRVTIYSHDVLLFLFGTSLL